MNKNSLAENFITNLKAEIIQHDTAGLADLRNILMQMKNAGFSSDETVQILETLRSEFFETEQEDTVLEAMGIATGWRQARWRVW